MPEKKRPPLTDSPAGSAVVRAKASSTERSPSPDSAAVSAAVKYGSTLAENVISDSPRLKLRSPGPISSPPGKNPAIA
jgi:hypothetical protein